MILDLLLATPMIAAALATPQPSPCAKPAPAFMALLAPPLRSEFAELEPLEPWELLVARQPLPFPLREEQPGYGIWSSGNSVITFSMLRRRRVDADDPTSRGEAWAALGFQSTDIRLSHSRELDLQLARLNTKTVLIDPNAFTNIPLRRTGWQAEDSLRMPLTGPLFVVGQVGANSASVEWQQYKVVGKTGLGWKLPAWLGGEVQIRGGRSLTNYDADSETLIPEQLRRFAEVSARVPVADWLNLEYTGESLAPLTPSGHEIRKHEVRLAFPLANSGQFHVGAKFRAEDLMNQNGWYERMKWFMGITWRR